MNLSSLSHFDSGGGKIRSLILESGSCNRVSEISDHFERNQPKLLYIDFEKMLGFLLHLFLL